MNAGITIKDFIKARDYMENIVVDGLTKLEVVIYDPWLKFVFEKEFKEMITALYKLRYPDIPVSFIFSVYIAAQTIEYSVQRYYHPFSQHIFLGSVNDTKKTGKNKQTTLVDCYYSTLYETFGEPRFLLRYGHGKKEMEEGSLNAASQFYNGEDTAMAKAYRLAMEAGYVKS